MQEEITKIYDRARSCTYCKIRIPKQERHIRFQHSNHYSSTTINICAECIERALNEIKDLKEIKERNAKIRVIERLKQ